MDSLTAGAGKPMQLSPSPLCRDQACPKFIPSPKRRAPQNLFSGGQPRVLLHESATLPLKNPLDRFAPSAPFLSDLKGEFVAVTSYPSVVSSTNGTRLSLRAAVCLSRSPGSCGRPMHGAPVGMRMRKTSHGPSTSSAALLSSLFVLHLSKHNT